MIKKIKFMQYRKFKDTEINFVEGVNVISGINGTCKTSLLHIVTNSFQKIKKEKFGDFGDFSKLNIMVNPKI